ncbi:MAG: pilus assembly protein [Chloroflexi bacterium]|nr:pilus assembly protein [Chloroflexota bacterium]
MSPILRARCAHTSRHARAQSLVETALLLPVLLLLLSGLVEFGFLLNRYLILLDAVRNAARFSSDSLYTAAFPDTACDVGAVSYPHFTDFFGQTACLVLRELGNEQPAVLLDPARDDVIVSAFSVEAGVGVTRFPPAFGEVGFAYFGNEASDFTTADINSMLEPLAPSTGLLLVEIWYHYDQVLRLPWIMAFLPDPVPLHLHTVMPLVSAEPTSTPNP